METNDEMSMRVIFTVTTMEQMAIIWAMAKESGLQPDMVPVMPAKKKRVNQYELLSIGDVEPATMNAKTQKAWARVKTHLKKTPAETKGHLAELVSKARGDVSGPRLVGLWVRSGSLRVATDAG